VVSWGWPYPFTFRATDWAASRRAVDSESREGVDLSSWTGEAFVCQRSQLASLKQRSEARRTGVYILVGSDPEHAGKDRVYIGEGDNVFDRLSAHDKDESKDFWTQVVLFISKDDSLTKAHVRYLERALIDRAKATGRASLANANYPDTRLLPEPDVADMAFFLDQIQLLLPVLGFTFLQPVPTPEQLLSAPEDETVSPLFVMSPVGTNAMAREYQGEFIVLKGSTARMQGVQSWTSYRQLRDQLVQEGQLTPDAEGRYYVFQNDVPFNSPSAAAAVIFGGNQNGTLTWKVKVTGQSYKAWKETKLANVEIHGIANTDTTD
jgi:hypothetical protein